MATLSPPQTKDSRSVLGEGLRIVLPLLILGAGIGGFFAFGKRAPPKPEGTNKIAPLVQTVGVQQHEQGLQLQVDGITVPFREIEISAEVPGLIKKKFDTCRAGKFVNQDAPLFEFDKREFELERQRLLRLQEQAKVEIVELEREISNTAALRALAASDLELQQKDIKRIKLLFTRKSITEAEVDQAQQRELTARNALVRLEGQESLYKKRQERLASALELAGVQLQRAELDLERTSISAPVAGVVIQDLVEQGAYVQKGTPLVVIEDTSRIEVRCSLRMEELHWIWRQRGASSPNGYELPPTKATVHYELGSRKYQWDGRLDRYEGLGLNEKTRTVPCRVVVDAPQSGRAGIDSPPGSAPPALVRGMYVRVTLSVDSDEELLLVPEQSLRPDNTVWKIVQESDSQSKEPRSILRRVSVDVVESLDSGVLVRIKGSDLQADDRVVVSPLESARDGMLVREMKP